MNELTRNIPGLTRAVVLTLVLTIAGCKSTPPADDNSLNSAVQAKISADAAISAEPIQSSVQAGTATLQGTVSSQAARSLAAADAAQVPGIRTVVNNLTVETAQAAPAPQPQPTVTPAPPVVTKPMASTSRRPIKPEPQPRYNPPPAPIERPVPRNAPLPPQQAEQAPIQQRPSPPPPQAFRNVTLPAGTTLPVRITQTLDSATTQQGDAFSGTIASDVLVDGLVAIPAGASVSGRVDEVHEAAHFKGSSLLTISLVSLNHRGDKTTLTTEPYSKQGNGRGKNTAEKVGGGAAVGAILGGIFGGGKGAAIGAAAGGGVGAGAQAITKGQQVQIPSESLVRFNLTSPISVRASTAPGNPNNDPTSSTAPTTTRTGNPVPHLRRSTIAPKVGM